VAPQNPVQWNAWAQIATTTSSLREILTQNDTPSLPIWVTEYGAPLAAQAPRRLLGGGIYPPTLIMWTRHSKRSWPPIRWKRR